MAGILRLVRQKQNPPHDPTELSFAGKTILVTGSNTGLGLEAAKKFAARGAKKVILAVRNVASGENAATIIKAAVPSADLAVEKLDMSSFDSIKACVASLRGSLGDAGLDVAVLNAGAVFASWSNDDLKWEPTLKINTLGTVLLAVLLVESGLLKQDGVLEFVNSGLHQTAAVQPGPSPIRRHSANAAWTGANPQYARSKLLLMAATKELALKWTGRVHVISVCPGMCKTELGRGFSGNPLYGLGMWVAGVTLMKTAEEGSRVYVSGAALGERGHGEFYQHDEVKAEAEPLRGEVGVQLRQDVWKELGDVLGEQEEWVAKLWEN